MSASDFFLLERAAQIQRLRQAKTDNPIRVPGRFSRLGYSPRAVEFFRALDEIARLPLEEKRKHNWLEKLQARGASLFGQRAADPAASDEQALLTPAARTAVETFEQHIVPILLDDDETAHPIAVALASAILGDSQNYYGLKPLQFHAEEFSYELLFPSWFNLYTALSLPCAKTGKPRFSLEQIKAIFSRLQELEEQGSPADPEWIATLAFLANRLPAPESHAFCQRMFDLRLLTAHGSTATLGPKLAYLQAQVDSAPRLLTLIKSLVIFETVVYRAKAGNKPRLVQHLPQFKPLPSFLTAHVQAIADQPEQFATWAYWLVQVARLIESGHGLDRDFGQIMEAHATAANLSEWLAMLIPTEDAPVLSRTGQRILAKVIRASEVDGQLNLAKIRQFAQHMAPRLNLLDEAALTLFEKQFIDHDTNRDVILASVSEPQRRQAISQKLIAGAQKTSDRARFFGQLGIAAVLDPECDATSMAGVGRTLNVLAILQEQGYISPTQFALLTDHLREHLPKATTILADPMRGIAGAEGSTGMLYLALAEVCMKYELTGVVDNFGLTTGAFSNLKRAGG